MALEVLQATGAQWPPVRLAASSDTFNSCKGQATGKLALTDWTSHAHFRPPADIRYHRLPGAKGLWIDRINPKGIRALRLPQGPQSEKANNRQSTRLSTNNGQTMTIANWSGTTDIGLNVIQSAQLGDHATKHSSLGDSRDSPIPVDTWKITPLL